MNILLSSAGRRPYLVRWFKEALVANQFNGEVIAADLDSDAPARAFADRFVVAPPVNDPAYDQWLRTALSDHEISLAISINDFELSRWARLPEASCYDALVRATPSSQELVEDKYKMGAHLLQMGVPSPKTWLASRPPTDENRSYVTKGRFGSASRGLRFAREASLDEAIFSATSEVTDRQGLSADVEGSADPRDLVVVQEEVVGVEYGLDVVCDLSGEYAAVLARRKVAMRAGETDRAVSVGSDRFEQIGKAIASAVPHRGTFDVDVIVDVDGRPNVIDINPRFGGGYPFSHLAGARVPHAYVAWAGRRPVSQEWLRSETGIVGGKYVEAVAIT